MSTGFYDTLEAFDDEPTCDATDAPVAQADPSRIFASGLGFRADRIVIEKLREIRRAGGRYNNSGTFLETSYDGQGFYLERGGIWNDRDGRVLLGVTKSDVTEVRSALRKVGVTRSVLEVEAVLASALRSADNCATLSKTEAFALDVKEYWRAQRRERIARLREAGLCIVCGREKVGGARSTCPSCGEKANARTKRRKAAA
jgi:hypothetical protein